MGPRANMEGLRREDAAKDNMRQYGFEESVIDETIKELVKLYGKDGWKLIEDGGYNVLLTRCLERQEEKAKEKAKEKEEPELTSPNSRRRLVRGVNASQRGWVSEDDEEEEKEEMDLDDSDDADDDNKVIRLVPEPLCEELEKLLRDVRGED